MSTFWQGAAGAAVAVLVSLLLFAHYKSRRAIHRKVLAKWMRELGVMLRHRVPIMAALGACAHDAPKKIVWLSFGLRKYVRSGEPLSSMLAYELALPQSVVSTISSGEAFGTLPEALIDAADLLMVRGKRWIGPQRPSLRVESEMEQRRIYEVAVSVVGESELPAKPGEEVAPLIRIANSILAQAIKSGAEFIEMEPVRTQKPPRMDDFQDEEEWRLMDMEIGPQLLVTFGREDVRWEAMRVPKYIMAPLYRRLKIMAEVPYWQKPPMSGRIAVRMDERDFDMYLDSEQHPLGEKLRLLIRESE